MPRVPRVPCRLCPPPPSLLLCVHCAPAHACVTASLTLPCAHARQLKICRLADRCQVRCLYCLYSYGLFSYDFYSYGHNYIDWRIGAKSGVSIAYIVMAFFSYDFYSYGHNYIGWRIGAKSGVSIASASRG